MGFKNWILNLILAGVAMIALLAVLYLSLDWYTKNGENIKLPNLKGIETEKAIEKLDDLGLRYLIVDSVYNVDLQKNTVSKQDPVAGSNVKSNRIIYLTINALEEPKSTMPELIDKSFTMARALLKARGLELGQIMYVYDSIGHNLVLEQNFAGKPVQAGQKLKKGSKIDVVIATNRILLVNKNDSTGLIMELDSLGNFIDSDRKKAMEDKLRSQGYSDRQIHEILKNQGRTTEEPDKE